MSDLISLFKKEKRRRNISLIYSWERKKKKQKTKKETKKLDKLWEISENYDFENT